MAHAPYPSDLTDVEWSVIEPLLPGPSKLGRPRENNFREVWDAFFYIARTGCQWRYLPHDFPPYTSVHRHFREWRDDGTLERVHDALRHTLRKASGKKRGSDGRYIGLTEREDDRSRWIEWLRSRQEGQGTQASNAGRFNGYDHRTGSAAS